MWIAIIKILLSTILLYLLNVIANRENQFCDGKYIKHLMLETAPFIFEEFANKDKITQA